MKRLSIVGIFGLIALFFFGFTAFAADAAAPAPSLDVVGLIKAILSGDWINAASTTVLFGLLVWESFVGNNDKIKANSTLGLVLNLVKGAIIGARDASRSLPSTGGVAATTAGAFPDAGRDTSGGNGG